MKREWAVGLLGFALIMTALSHCVGCLSQETKSAVSDSTYAADHLRCVSENKTKKAIDACREMVRLSWGVERPVDGGTD